MLLFLSDMSWMLVGCLGQRITSQPSGRVLRGNLHFSYIKAVLMIYLNWFLVCLYFNRKKLCSCYLVKIDHKLPNRLFTIWCDKIKILEMDKNNLILYNLIIFLKAGYDTCHVDAGIWSQVLMLCCCLTFKSNFWLLFFFFKEGYHTNLMPNSSWLLNDTFPDCVLIIELKKGVWVEKEFWMAEIMYFDTL